MIDESIHKKLPHNIKPIVSEIFNENVFLKKENTSLKEINQSLSDKIGSLSEENKRLRRELYGSKSERHSPQKDEKCEVPVKDRTFNEAEKISEESHESENKLEEFLEEISQKKQDLPSQKTSTGKKSFPESLPREVKEHDLNESQKLCPYDGSHLKFLSTQEVEKAEYIPAHIKIIKHRYHTYVCPCCEAIQRSPVEPSVIPGAQCEAGLLAQIVVQKYLYSLPLYRQSDMLNQIELDFSRSTLARWMIKSAEFLKPLVTLLKEKILSHTIVHADETSVQVLKETGKAATSKSYMWILCTGNWEKPCIYFEYHPNRSQTSAHHLLQDFEGFLQVDGYGGYNALAAKSTITRVACWAHVRRKFETALVAGSSKGASEVEKFIESIKKLFLLEREIEDLSSTDRLLLRQEKSLVIVNEIHELLQQKIETVPPTSKFGIALHYLKNEWNGLVEFLNNANLSISNNRLENFIRPFAIGRKNWLFSDTVAGAQASSILYSLAVTGSVSIFL